MGEERAIWRAKVWDGKDCLVWIEDFLSENAAESYRMSVEGRRQGFQVTIDRW